MSAISSLKEIREWAEATVAAKGEKYTSLSKADQLAIATFITKSLHEEEEKVLNEAEKEMAAEVASEGVGKPPVNPDEDAAPKQPEEQPQGYATPDGEVTVPPADGDGEQKPLEDHEGVPAKAEDHPDAKPIEDNEGVVTGHFADGIPKATITKKVPRYVMLKDKTAQAAYDEFLAWKREHEKDATVMDFSAGKYLPTAAFAFWLTMPVEKVVGTID